MPDDRTSRPMSPWIRWPSSGTSMTVISGAITPCGNVRDTSYTLHGWADDDGVAICATPRGVNWSCWITSGLTAVPEAPVSINAMISTGAGIGLPCCLSKSAVGPETPMRTWHTGPVLRRSGTWEVNEGTSGEGEYRRSLGWVWRYFNSIFLPSSIKFPLLLTNCWGFRPVFSLNSLTNWLISYVSFDLYAESDFSSSL